MDETAYIMEAIAGVVFLAVGVRLYRLSRRSRQAPEHLIALTFLIWALGYALYDIPYAFVEGDQSVPPQFAYASLLAFGVGNVTLALFNREVFRKGDRWAGWLVVAIAAGLALGSAGSAWVGDWEQIDPLANPGYWPQTLGGLAPAVWMGVEGFVHHAAARKRRALGLCTPLSCHRFLLWGLAGLCWSWLEIVLVFQDYIYLSAGDWSDALGVANGLLEIVPIALMWLVFFAPARYARWVERGSSA